MRAPFPYFGGKSSIAPLVWARLGEPKQYIEPFCGSAAMLLSAPRPASLEVIGDASLYVANFWRALRSQPDEVWRWSDYPVSHVDLDARHRWLTRAALRAELLVSLGDPDWPGDAKVAGWWVWGQCCWIGSGWCSRVRTDPARGQCGDGTAGDSDCGKIPHAGNAGRGLQANGLGKIPHASDAGRGDELSAWRSGSRDWLRQLSARLERVRITHGSWDRCLNSHYGGASTAVFLDPPYRAYETLYENATPVADAVAEWAAQHPELRIALCGHAGDYDIAGWDVVAWERPGNSYGGDSTKDAERIWFSPACLRSSIAVQGSLFA